MIIRNIKPEDIEKRSFEIIDEELAASGFEPRRLSEEEIRVIKRCIHTTADFEYAKTMCFSYGAVKKMKSLIREGATIVTDTNMALAGINKKELDKYGCKAVCYMADKDIASKAEELGLTRACVSMEKAMVNDGPVIFVVGNAPTALITLKEHYEKREYTPAFVVGVPVGFVNVVVAKEMIVNSYIPHIVNRGRKGGSTVAAAIVNAVLYDMRNNSRRFY